MLDPFTKRAAGHDNHPTYDYPWAAKYGETGDGVKLLAWVIIRNPLGDAWEADVYTGNGLPPIIRVTSGGPRMASQAVAIPAAGLCSVVSLTDCELDVRYLERRVSA